MENDFLLILGVALLLLVCGVLVLIGRGDWLISGYNTASEERRAKYNIFRLRLVVGVMCIYVAIAEIVGYYIDSEVFMLCAILPAVVISMILTYTWARRK